MWRLKEQEFGISHDEKKSSRSTSNTRYDMEFSQAQEEDVLNPSHIDLLNPSQVDLRNPSRLL